MRKIVQTVYMPMNICTPICLVEKKLPMRL